MSNSVESRGLIVWEAPTEKPLDEVVWQAWLQKNRAQDMQRRDTRIRVIRWTLIVALLAVAGLWSQITPYQVMVRFIVATGAMVLMFQAVHVRHYAFATVFAALVLLFNPVAPLFYFSGHWQRALVAVSVAPFIASFAVGNMRTNHHV